MKNKIEKRTLQISYSNIEDAIASFLIATSVVADNEEVIDVEVPLSSINSDGTVDITVSVSKL